MLMLHQHQAEMKLALCPKGNEAGLPALMPALQMPPQDLRPGTESRTR
jgi:hypothetical protein